ncbi:hypothetical protein HYG81_26020 (plasmid) [Natrinema zhouii]|uniref:hypothetical protein n=1 Tax=Natrinema zhouii TaxID=1710539 RepID=UPI001CFFDD0A|nr:hypothetical protein [Natrinema zhouii]UHQ99287.1 hypothetical protein HYG81_26020 [Natrinema zhouii]
MSLPERQTELIDTHRAIQDAGLPYVLVVGWAVSAFQARFTTDVDMVLPEISLDEYDALLTNAGYIREFDNDVANIYEGRIVRYEKPVGENTVEFDALVGALRCRQTDAEWSYRYLEEHSLVESFDVAKQKLRTFSIYCGSLLLVVTNPHVPTISAHSIISIFILKDRGIDRHLVD